MNKIKVLEVISSLEPTGGGETFAVNLSRELSELVELKVVILYKNNKSFFINRLKEKNIDFEILDKRKHFDRNNFKQLGKIINCFEPNVIHTENNALIPVFFALKSFESRKKPYVFHTMHLEPKDECSNSLVRLLYKHILQKKQFVPVAISEKLATVSSNYYKIKKVPYINNGVDLEPFSSKKSIIDRQYDIVVVGRFSKQKNHKFLLNVFSKLQTIHHDIRIVLVGGGELFDETKDLAKTLGLSNNIEFTGILDSPAAFVNNSKIILLGSLFEANPLSLLEGMSSGCIVVSSNVGGIQDIIKEGKNGFLLPINDELAFTTTIDNILKNVDKFSSMSESNVIYSKNFSMKECANKYLSLFCKVMGGKR